MHTDMVGKRLSIDDIVRIERIPEELLRGLPDEDQEAIKGCLGQHLTISGFDSYGNSEIEFIDEKGNTHTIWVRTDCLVWKSKGRLGKQ